MKIAKRILFTFLILLLVLGGIGLWLLFGSRTSNPKNYAHIGEIPPPSGYERVVGTNPGYTQFLRALPLKPKGSKVHLYTGGKAFFQPMNYAVVDLPLLSNAEQCADACMRLRAEYFYQTGQYNNIQFQDVNGHTLRYRGGASREALHRYLRHLYGVASTFSLSREMQPRTLAEIQPGDVFVYPGKGQFLGHAVLVVDVAVNKDGKKAFLLAEGNTPACDIHLIRNLENPFRSPWFMTDGSEKRFLLSLTPFKATDLRHN